LRPAAPLAALADRTSAAFAVTGTTGGAPVGGLIAGSLTAHGGTRLAFAFAGTMALLVAATGAAVLLLTGRRPAAVPPSTLEVQA
jgi:hypothetical protein